MSMFLTRISIFFSIILSATSCSLQKGLNYSSEYIIPVKDFEKTEANFTLDYSHPKNWAFRSDLHDDKSLIPKNYNYKNEELFNVSVFYIHPTSLFSSLKWNADTTHFQNNHLIDLCLENQASIFAGLSDLYAPHYREMHIYSYTDTINGIKAFNVAYNDVLTSFKYFLKNIKTDKFIIASHSQGTNHAKKLINEYIFPNKSLLDRLLLSYLIGMDITDGEMKIELCDDPDQLYCFLNWRSFNELYYPDNWNYGTNYISINPITYNSGFLFSEKNKHKGILFPNKKILFRKSLMVRNEKGLLWVKLPKNIFVNRFKRNSYHNADFNLFWVNIRLNLINRLQQL
tara:strand:+ start:1201 stop:2229 length:1029 start_codon:yes stop_codon:yes gene_type:complete